MNIDMNTRRGSQTGALPRRMCIYMYVPPLSSNYISPPSIYPLRQEC